jgi:hypothetical protein
LKPTYLCRSHPDFHVPAEVEVGVGFDGCSYARRLKRAGADAVAFFAKCHYGHAYYHTRVGHPHPRLAKDMLADVVRGCRAEGLGVIAYYSVFLDTAAVLRNPDWLLKACSDFTIQNGFDSGRFLQVCVNSPYADQLLIPQSIEVVTNYDVDELIYDTMTMFKPCCCATCERLFGGPIPQSAADARWPDYVRWYRDCYEKFFAKVAAQVHAANPKVAILFNWEWGTRTPVLPPPHITRLAADLIPTGTVASAICRYFAGTGYPFDYMTGRFLHGLGNWNNAPGPTIKYTAACTVANGGGFYIIDRQLPNGDLEERGYAMMRDVFGFIQERRAVLEGTVHVPEIAVLHSFRSLMGDQLQFFPDHTARRERSEAFEGVSRLCMQHARHYTALGTERLLQTMHDYRLVILPETEYLEAETVAALQRYVEAGGNLLITQAAAPAGVCNALLAWAGVTLHGFSQRDYGYFARPDAEPIAARGMWANVTPAADAQAIVARVEPLTFGDGTATFGHGYAPPGLPSPYATAIERRVGKGRVIYVAMPVFKQYWQFQNFHVAALMLELVDRLLPDPLVRAHTDAQVELAVMRKSDDLIVHLVNHSGREQLGGYYHPVTEYMPELRGIRLAIRTGVPGATLRLEPGARRVKTAVRKGYLTLSIPSLQFMETVRVQNYFTPTTSARQETQKRTHTAQDR